MASWRVLGGEATGALSAVATAPRAGFETAIPLAQTHARFQLQALDSEGRVLGTSPPFTG